MSRELYCPLSTSSRFSSREQTSQYIGMGVREAMEQDFSPLIKELFQGPTANLERATREARSVMAEVGKEARFHAFSWVRCSLWES